jgi:homoserine O-acetyltransferase
MAPYLLPPYLLPQADAAWNPRTARFTGRPSRALEAFGAIYAGWGVGAGWYLNRRYAAAGFGSAEEFVTGSYLGAFAECDADDLLSQVRGARVEVG